PTWSRTSERARSARRWPTIPRPMPTPIAGLPNSSGIICADNHRWRQPGSSRGWRAMGTWSSVDARGERSMDLGLRGKVALVTAAGKGMGKACAMGFATEGARVAVCARTEADIKTAAEEVRVKTGAEVLAMAADVTRADDVK